MAQNAIATNDSTGNVAQDVSPRYARKERIFLLPENYFTHVVNDVAYQVRVVTVRREDTTTRVPGPQDTVNIFGHRSGLIDVVAFEDAPGAIQNMYVAHASRRTR